MNAFEKWHPIKFDAEGERAYFRHMLGSTIPLLRLACVFGLLSFAGYQFWDLLLDPQALYTTGPLRLAMAFFFVICIGLTFLPAVRGNPKYLPFVALFVYLGVAVGFTLILSRLPGGFAAGNAGFILGIVLVPTLVTGARQATWVLVPYFAALLLVMFVTGGGQFDIINAISWVGGGVAFAIGFAYLLDIIYRRAFHLERMLEQEKQRSEELLLNILPAEIAARLMEEEGVLADSHESVTVLFADLAGFTNISRKMPAKELVDLLNDLFSRFDQLVEKHGAEKIKTIGDAYMVAAGLSDSVADHAEKIADLALGMRQAFGDFRRDNGVDLKLRIGVHSGAVVAGVIGKQKFAYDLWGDTVNIASRMESEGLPDQIQISAETWKMLSERYQSTSRGQIKIKGHSARATYLLDGRA
jgi:class 3 adenylate cyclase